MAKLHPDEETTIRTYDEIAKIWATKYHQNGFWAEEMQNFQKYLPKGRILDIGAGGGRDAEDLAKLGFDIVGTDISKKLLKIAQQRLPGIKFYLQSIYELKFDDEPKFDGFWASAVILHLPKSRVDEALQQIASVVRKGAVGFISLKDGEGEVMQKESWFGKSHPRLFAYYSKDEFEKILKRNNYELVGYRFRIDSQETRWHCFFVRVN